MAYRSYHALYHEFDGHVQKMALLNLVRIRPGESTFWYLEAIQVDDWMTANLAMDSLVASSHFEPDELISVYHEPDVREEVQWRIVYIFGHRDGTGSLPFLIEAFQDESWLVHTEAAVGLGCRDPEQVIPEMKAMKNDARHYVRHNSRWVIRRLRNL
jgi:HEAT repeat protein